MTTKVIDRKVKANCQVRVFWIPSKKTKAISIKTDKTHSEVTEEIRGFLEKNG